MELEDRAMERLLSNLERSLGLSAPTLPEGESA